MQILDNRRAYQKVARIATQILENNFEAKALMLLGINNLGYQFAEILKKELDARPQTLDVSIHRIRLNPAAPNKSDIMLEAPIGDVQAKNVIIVDDVANTGRTIFYAMQPLMAALPKKIEVAVLVDRKHKNFPIKVDYVGLSFATTLKDHIDVQIKDNQINVWME